MEGKELKRRFITKLIKNIKAIPEDKEKWPKIDINKYITVAEKLRNKTEEINKALHSSIEKKVAEIKASQTSMQYYLARNTEMPDFYKKKMEENINIMEWQILTISDENILRLITNLAGIVLDFINQDYYERKKKDWDFNIFEGRPGSKITLGQLFCTPDTTFRRVELITRDFSSPDTKVLFVGDDDLCSLALKSMADFEVHMLDLDRALIRFIKSKNMDIKTHVVNLSKGVPEEFHNYFDAVMLDPFWDIERTEMFLNPAYECLKKDSRSRIYMSVCPFVAGKDYKTLQMKVLEKELFFLEIIKHFSYYTMTPDKGGYGEVIKLFREINEEKIKSDYLDKVISLPLFFSNMHILGL